MNTNDSTQTVKMADSIPSIFYGPNCPMTALESVSGSDTFKLPNCDNDNAMTALDAIIGYTKFNETLFTKDIKEWLVAIDKYLDIPILGVLGRSVINFESKNFWKKLLGCPGIMAFLTNIEVKLENEKIFCMCASFGRLYVLKWLVKNGSAYSYYHALYNSCEKGHIDIATWIIEWCDGGKSVISINVNEFLLVSSRNGQLECAKLCVENGANNFDDALYYACRNGQLECAKFCVENGANNFNDALNYACIDGQLECAKLCVEKGANNFNHALEYACLNGHIEIAKFCVENGANNFDYALYYACSTGHLECAKFCVENGAKDTGLEYACSNGHLEIAKFCVDSGATKCSNCNGDKHEINMS
jgi:cytoskeletal protein CcmA (bactofilin family)